MMRRELVTGYIYTKGVKVKRIEEHRDRLIKIIREINSLSPNSIIIVEGKTDKQAIHSLILNNIEISTYHKFRKLVLKDNLFSEYLILTDFDEEGEKLYRSIKQMMLESGVKENRIRDDIRERIRKYLTIYGFEIYDAISSLKKRAGVDSKVFKMYVMPDYSHLLYDKR